LFCKFGGVVCYQAGGQGLPEYCRPFMNKDFLPQRAQSTRRKAEDREKHPERWSGEIRNWDMLDEVYLNPENE